MMRLACLCLAAFLTACAGNPPAESHYRVEAERSGTAASAPRFAGKLRIAPLRAAEGYRDWRFVYRETDYRYASDPYRGFVAPPAQLVTERLSAWIAASGLFGEVLGAQLDAVDWTLAGRLDALYADLRPNGERQVVVRLNLVLSRDGQLRDSRNITAAAPISSMDGDGIAAAADAALGNAFRQYEAALALTDPALSR
ncbi:ABC-type transport auxiliary lipoprotein family protein [Chitinolyticbacter meiyuanensis]|uniref:ABC-type transport auxiliary lipoprotein family protein n=1 Tax=Chitinolyticbacter meiyuanensis TaxID=682798 RepID=UPI0011E5E6C1|nr:ABC-type transport auxiliary lipoprotein family protein [Chitinolyticbacter meiyuanensis]